MSRGVAEEVRRAAILQYEGYLAAQTAMAEARRTDLGGDGIGEEKGAGQAKGEAAEQLRQVLQRASAVERDLVLEARTRGEVSAATADEVLRDIEVRALRDFG